MSSTIPEDEINTEFEFPARVKGELSQLQSETIEEIQEAAEEGNFWDAIREANDTKRSIGFDTATTIAEQTEIDLSEQEDTEYVEKLVRYANAGMSGNRIADHLYSDKTEIRRDIPGSVQRYNSGFQHFGQDKIGQIIDEAMNGKDAHQIAEVLEIDQEEAVNVMTDASLENYSQKDTFEATRDYEVNENVDPEAAIYWYLGEEKDQASATELMDFVNEVADLNLDKSYEMAEMLTVLEDEGRVQSSYGEDEYNGMAKNAVYSLAFQFGDIELEEGQENLLQEVSDYKMD